MIIETLSLREAKEEAEAHEKAKREAWKKDTSKLRADVATAN